MIRRLLKNRKGQGLVEYGLVIAGVALMAAAAVSVFGSKTTQLIGAVAAVIPGGTAADNAPILNTRLIETGPAPGTTGIGLALDQIAAHSDGNTDRLLGSCCGFDVAAGQTGFMGLLVQPQ